MAVNEEGARRLELLHPLLYRYGTDLIPFSPRTGAEKEEQLFCFAIDEVQSRCIEPDAGVFLGPLRAAGYRETTPDGGMGSRAAFNGETLELPRGPYLFAQKREALGKSAVIDLAIEVQKDGLWERLHLETYFYLRYLYEDDATVTQIFRPYHDS
ncbi:MAG: hypothetical protein LBF63_00590 [Treponema sp.]|nr:hypothetical protein [Treponema sp.]